MHYWVTTLRQATVFSNRKLTMRRKKRGLSKMAGLVVRQEVQPVKPDIARSIHMLRHQAMDSRHLTRKRSVQGRDRIPHQAQVVLKR